MGEKVRLAWSEGHLVLEVKDEWCEVKASNYTMAFTPRSIEVHGKTLGGMEASDRKKRHIYIKLAENLKPLPGPGRPSFSGIIGGFEVILTDVEFSRFLTIRTPGYYLYDYAVLTDSQVYAELSARRRAYFDRKEQGTTVYIV